MSPAVLPHLESPAPIATPTLVDLANFVRPGERLLATGVSYTDYVRLTDWRDASGRNSIRFAFDRGNLEIMVVTNPHERFKKIVALSIEAWIEETGGRYVPSGQLTHRREDLERGFEPDECYYIQNCDRVLGVREIDFAKDPPPDLAVEAEVSRPLLDRLPIFAAFRVTEVWRYNGERLMVLLLQPDGSYRETMASLALPSLPLGELPRFLEMASDRDYASIGRQFRSWIRSLRKDVPDSDSINS